MSKGLRLAFVIILVLLALLVDLMALGIIKLGERTTVSEVNIDVTGTTSTVPITSTVTGDESESSESTLRLRFGLDIKGGVHVVLEAYPLETTTTATTNQLLAQEVEELIQVLENRINALGLSEVVIYRDKAVPNRIIMEIPIDIKGGSLTPDDIVELLGKPAVLEFRDPTGEEVLLTGKDLVKAYPGVDPNNSAYYAVYLEFNKDGAEKFAKITSDYLGKPIPIVLDGKVISAPVVQSIIAG